MPTARGVAIACALSVCLGVAPRVTAEPDGVIDLAGAWRFQPGDDLAWSAPHLDDRGWASLRVPGSWGRQGYAGVYGFAWYRLRVELPAERSEGLSWAVTLGKVDSAYELYAGGALLGGVGGLPPAARLEYDRHRTFIIPPAAIQADGSLVLALRVWRAPFKSSGAAGPVEGPFLAGPAPALVRRAALAELPDLLLVAAFLLAGVYHLWLSRLRPRAAEYLWFGLMAFQAGLYCFLRTQWKYELSGEFVWLKKGEHVLLYLVPATLVQFVGPLVGARIGRGLRAFQVGSLAAAAVLAASPGLRVALALLPLVQVVFALAGLRLVVLLAQRFRAGNPEARRLVPALALLVAALLHDAFVERGLLSAPRLGKYAFALVVVGMAVLLADRFARTLRELEALRRDLERRVEERTGELEEAYRRLEHAASHDALTGLLVRRALDERGREELRRAERAGRPCSVLLLDVDRFKSINDRFGHAAGDAALRAIAGAMRSALRPYDAAGRWGGEEFAAVLPDTAPADALAVAERLRASIAALGPDATGVADLSLSASIGVAGRALARSEDTLEGLLGDADRALYRAKADGRDLVRLAAVESGAA